jgi:hypothetical protein
MRQPGETLVLLSLLCCGCATYGFDVVQPAVADRAIGGDQWTSVTIDPLVYKLRADEGRLVMRIYNPTSDAIELLGGKSTVVDPDGLSHPLHSQVMAPETDIAYVFPPLRDTATGGEPEIGIGAGNFDSPGYIAPSGYQAASTPPIPSAASAYDFDWEGESDVSMTLVYKRGDSTFSQSLAFHRVKR